MKTAVDIQRQAAEPKKIDGPTEPTTVAENTLAEEPREKEQGETYIGNPEWDFGTLPEHIQY